MGVAKAFPSVISRLAQRAATVEWRLDRRRMLSYGLGLLAPILTAMIANGLEDLLGTTRLSFLFLASVLCVGVFLGAGPAIAAALTAFATYNFYLVEPRYTLRLVSVDDFDLLLAFLIAAGATGALAGRLRDEARTSRRRLATTQVLFEASRRLSNAIRAEEIDQTLAESAARAFEAPAVVVREGGIVARCSFDDAPDCAAEDAKAARLIACSNELAASHETLAAAEDWRVAAIRGRNGVHGALAVAVNGPRAQDNERALALLAGLGAVALDRSRLIAEMAEAEALAQSERLRTALLSSVSHDFRTPLATILASSTSLLDYGARIEEAARNDLVQSIREEAERMNRYVASLLDMTRLEAGALAPRLARIDVLDVVAGAVSRLKRHAASKGVQLVGSGPVVHAFADPVLLEQAIVNVVENAVALTPARGRIAIEVARADDDDRVRIAVTDEGPGIPEHALTRVFDKFFRIEGKRERAGAGLGLSIAKGIVEAMGGAIAAESPVRDGRGARFVLKLRPQPATSGAP